MPLASGGGGGQTQDHQAPVYIVGNAPNGDTAFVCDFLDPGDGSGIAAALAAAAGVKRSAVWVRAGQYALNAGSVPTPLVVGSGTTLMGAGAESAEILGRTSGDLSIFDMQQGAQIRDLGITSQNPSGVVSNVFLVRMAASCVLRDVAVQATTALGTTLKSAVLIVGDGCVVSDSFISATGDAQSTCIDAVANDAVVRDCRLISDNLAVSMTGNGCELRGCAGDGGALATMSGDGIRVSDCSWRINTAAVPSPAVFFSGVSRGILSSLLLDDPAASAPSAIRLGGSPADESRTSVMGCVIRGAAVGVEVMSGQQNDSILGNLIQGAVTPVSDSGVGTNVTANVY